MMGGKDSPVGGLIISLGKSPARKGGGAPDGDEMPGEDEEKDMGAEASMQAFMDAFNSGDPKAAVSAFKDLMENCSY